MNIKNYLTPEEIAWVTEKNNFRGAMIVAFDWIVITSLFVLAAAYPNPLVLLLVVALLGGRQLGLGVIVHETGHRSMFRQQWLNEFCGTWLSGYWVFSDKDAYMRNHLKHHQLAGTGEDPDLANFEAYPIPRTSFWRKMWRDLSGQIGWRRIKSIARSIRRLPQLKPQIRQTVQRSIIVNGAMLGVMTLAGAPWLFLLWVAAFMTSHMLVTRIRQIAEHAAVPDHFSDDPRENTRTIYINWLERLFIAPHEVNYHLEHHMLASVPIYRLRRLHQLLLRKGFYKEVEFPVGYFHLLRRVTHAA